VPTVFDKLNLKDQKAILVLDAPASFAAETRHIKAARVLRRLEDLDQVQFAVIFVTRQSEVDRLATAVTAKAAGDALLWFAYPKGTSKQYSCDFNRDTGWNRLRQLGFDTVRQVAIDEDWSALRFRRVEFIKKK
jgi:hypothetical protein